MWLTIYNYSLVASGIALLFNRDRKYSPRGIIFEGWIKELFHSQPLNKFFVYTEVYTLNNCFIITSLYFIWWCGTVQRYWRINNAEDIFHQSNYRKSNLAPEKTWKLFSQYSLYIQELWKIALLSPELHIGNIFTEV